MRRATRRAGPPPAPRVPSYSTAALAGRWLLTATAAARVGTYSRAAIPGSARMATPESTDDDAPPSQLVVSPTGSESGPVSPGLWSPPQKQRPRSLAAPVSPQLPASVTGKTLGVFIRRTVGRTAWLFYSRPAAEFPSRVSALLGSGAQTTTVGKIGLTLADGVAFVEQIEVYQQYRGHQLAPEMLADLEVVLRNDGERQHLLGCGPINELRLLALEDAERHGKLEALYHKNGFRTTGPSRFECDTDHTYRHVPMAKVLEPLVFVCVPRSLARGQPHEQHASGLRHAAHAVSVAERSTPEGSRSTYPGQDSCICSDMPSEPFA